MESDFQAHIRRIFVHNVGRILESLNYFVSTVGLGCLTKEASFANKKSKMFFFNKFDKFVKVNSGIRITNAN